jgi:hypothetical protein
MLRYHKGALAFSLVSLAAAAWLGFSTTGTLAGTLGIVWIVAVLGVLEVSLSFDNAVVNASVLKDMDPVWRRRFLTWGILIAVFGMRIIFPLAIVAVAARIGPIEAVRLAITDPVTYERIITGAHIGIAGFGGAFLAMVGLGFFLDEEKEVHWFGALERPLGGVAGIPSLAIGIVLASLYAISTLLPGDERATFLSAGIVGLLAFVVVDVIGEALGGAGEEDSGAADHGGAAATGVAARSGLAAFLYLELLDASFSFDGVIGAFALSNNLFVTALGLGIGAMFVRSITIMLVEKGTLSEYRFLEHGAFYAIVALAAIMLPSARFEIPETVTGLIGAAFIGVSFLASLRHNRAAATPAVPGVRPL